jgi:hypothetical protein
MLSEWNLETMNLQVAERCFIEGQITSGVHFMRKIAAISGQAVQRGSVAWFLKKYGEAEQHFRGTDLAVQIYATVGN